MLLLTWKRLTLSDAHLAIQRYFFRQFLLGVILDFEKRDQSILLLYHKQTKQKNEK